MPKQKRICHEEGKNLHLEREGHYHNEAFFICVLCSIFSELVSKINRYGYSENLQFNEQRPLSLSPYLVSYTAGFNQTLASH
jgi:hypothetical protein